jgi:Spy/CpxP family protein refolding chaperone
METLARPPKKVRLLTALVVVAVFGAGFAAGAAFQRFAATPHGTLAPPPHMGPLPLGELGLSDEQQKQAHEILERHRPELEAAVRETFPRIRAVNEAIEREFREILTAEQTARFDSLKSRRPRPHAGPPLGPPPPPFGPPPGPHGDAMPPFPPGPRLPPPPAQPPAP